MNLCTLGCLTLSIGTEIVGSVIDLFTKVSSVRQIVTDFNMNYMTYMEKAAILAIRTLHTQAKCLICKLK